MWDADYFTALSDKIWGFFVLNVWISPKNQTLLTL